MKRIGDRVYELDPASKASGSPFRKGGYTDLERAIDLLKEYLAGVNVVTFNISSYPWLFAQ